MQHRVAVAQVDTFDRIYNLERLHQGLPGWITPQQAWDATPVAEPSRPKVKVLHAMVPPEVSPYRSEHTVDGVRTTKVRGDGTVRARKIEFRLGSSWAGETIHVISGKRLVAFVDLDGVIIAEQPWPLPGVAYVGTNQLNRPQVSPMS